MPPITNSSDTGSQDFIGAGWSFPLRFDSNGAVSLSRGDQDVQEAIRLVLGTAYGERPMRPEFGCGIHDLVFGTIDNSLTARIAYEVRASLERWEPRITVWNVGVDIDPASRTTVYITIDYSLASTNDRRNLVFPFYFIPEGED